MKIPGQVCGVLSNGDFTNFWKVTKSNAITYTILGNQRDFLTGLDFNRFFFNSLWCLGEIIPSYKATAFKVILYEYIHTYLHMKFMIGFHINFSKIFSVSYHSYAYALSTFSSCSPPPHLILSNPCFLFTLLLYFFPYLQTPHVFLPVSYLYSALKTHI